jgi:hypothetical protein
MKGSNKKFRLSDMPIILLRLSKHMYSIIKKNAMDEGHSTPLNSINTLSLRRFSWMG